MLSETKMFLHPPGKLLSLLSTLFNPTSNLLIFIFINLNLNLIPEFFRINNGTQTTDLSALEELPLVLLEGLLKMNIWGIDSLNVEAAGINQEEGAEKDLAQTTAMKVEWPQISASNHKKQW